MTRDRDVALDWLAALRGRRPRRRGREAADGAYLARQARDDQDQARAHRRLRRRRASAGTRAGDARRVTAAGAVRRAGHAPSCGVTSAFTMATRQQLARELEPLRKNALAGHPWATGPQVPTGDGVHAHARRPEPLERGEGPVVGAAANRARLRGEVRPPAGRSRFRHAAIFLRWRPDKPPADCRYDQLEVTPPFELAKVFGAGAR